MKIKALLLMVSVLFAAPSWAGIGSYFGLDDDDDAASAVEGAASAMGMEDGLAALASSQLGLSSEQAAGGLGSLFSLAKSNLSGDEFGQLADAIPGMDSLLAAAPLLSSSSELLEQFSALGIDADMIGPMVELVTQFLGSQGGSGLTDLFTKGIGDLLG